MHIKPHLFTKFHTSKHLGKGVTQICMFTRIQPEGEEKKEYEQFRKRHFPIVKKSPFLTNHSFDGIVTMM